MTTYIGGIDIGGTKIAVTLADASGPLARITAPTQKSGAVQALPLQAIALLDAACHQIGLAPAQLQRVGVSSTGPFLHIENRLWMASPNICGGLSASSTIPNDWTRLPLQQVLEERFARVEIRNDCVAALVGERTFGAVIDVANCVYVTWSTGIGFGLCVDGYLLAGKQGNAGHAGHVLMDPHGTVQCGCGNLGDLESLIAGSHIAAGTDLDTPTLFAAARAADPAALKRVRAAAGWLGRALYNLVATLDTQVFVIGGSVWQHHGDWLAPLVQHELASRFPVLTQGVTMTPAGLDAYVADVGALCLVMPPAWIAPWREQQPWQRLRYLPK